jgi:HK97 family phage major capsid protein/HK97 family phage prohead protease
MTETLEIKAQLSVDDAGTITGIAWPFGSPDRVGDAITKGAFGSVERLPMLFAHDQAQAVGVWDSVAETDEGLTVKGRLLIEDVARAREVRALVREGAVTGLSIGFVTRKATPRQGGGRTISAVDLHEISIVAIPAHPGARISTVKGINPVDPEENDNAALELKAVNDNMASLTGTLDKVTGRLDKLEAKLNRPHISNDNGETEPDVERKAFTEFARKGVERMEQKAVAALTVSTDSQGGYLAPEAFRAEILKKIVEFSPIRTYARVLSITASEIKLPRKLTGTTASWVSETGDRSQSDMTFEQATFTPYELATYVDVSTQLLEDNAYNLEGELAADFAEAFGKAEGTAFVTGNGTGKPKGLLSASGITEVKSGNASTLGTDPASLIIGIYHSVPTVVAQNGAWVMNRNTLSTLRKIKDSDGRFLMVDPITAGMPITLLGRPIVEATDMPDIGADANPILFGDLSGYRIIDRVGLSVLRDPFTQATKGTVRFHARKRVGGDVSNPDRFVKLKIAA